MRSSIQIHYYRRLNLKLFYQNGQALIVQNKQNIGFTLELLMIYNYNALPLLIYSIHVKYLYSPRYKYNTY
jgi:hypothetical protein